jgi:hypothetical protein
VLLPLVVFADYGSGAVEISCDAASDTLTINTYIKWNEDYESFITAHPNGSVVGKKDAVFLLDAIKGVVNYECQLKKSSYVVNISSSGHLAVTSEGITIYKFTDVYPSDNDIYGLSYTNQKYYLKITSGGKVIECATRTQDKEVCKPYIMEK